MRLASRLPPLARRAGAAGIAALLACIVIAFFGGRAAFFEAWLVTWLFLLGIALASMADVMIHELTGGEWGLVLRPALEPAMATLPLLALLAIPLAFGMPDLFAWARGGDAAIDAKRWFLNAPAFVVRNAAWLVVWSAFALAMRRQLAGGAPTTPAGRRIAIAGLLVYLFTVTVVAIDWVASLVPDWHSTAIGVRVGSAQFVAAFGFAVSFAALRGGAAAARPRDFQDLGNLLLTFSMTWAYIAFTQYLIVWGEDLPHETSWFAPRALTSWRFLVVAVAALVFGLPTLAMLFRRVKHSAAGLAAVCVLALAGCWLDTFWLVVPSVRPHGFELRPIDILALIAEGGLWIAAVAVIAERTPARALPRQRSTAHG